MNLRNQFSNADSEPYWAAAREGRLLFQTCRGCGSVQFPPRHHCAVCWEVDLEWIQSTGRGRVESCTIVHRAPLPRFADRVPYAVAAVVVEEGPRMITNIVGDDALDVRIGDGVEVTFEPADGDAVLPVFRRLGSRAET